MSINQIGYQNALAIIMIASLASIFLLIQPGYSTIISNRSNTNNNNSDVSKEVFVVDYANVRIQKFDTDGKFITKWGSEGDGEGQFKIPHGIAVDSSGSSVYVTDMTGLSINKFTRNGEFITKWGSEGSADNQFQDPHSVAVY